MAWQPSIDEDTSLQALGVEELERLPEAPAPARGGGRTT